LTAAFFKGVGQLPVDRSGVRGAGEAAIRSGLAVLERGELFGIYPEGTRSPDGRLYRGKPGGLARVALASNAPVIPVAMIDTEKVQPVGKVMPKFSVRPGIRIGRPLDFSRYRGMEGDRFILRSVTDEVMYEIMKLSGQEYVDIYATAAKRQIAEAAKRTATESREPAQGDHGREQDERAHRERQEGAGRPTGHDGPEQRGSGSDRTTPSEVARPDPAVDPGDHPEACAARHEVTGFPSAPGAGTRYGEHAAHATGSAGQEHSSGT